MTDTEKGALRGALALVAMTALAVGSVAVISSTQKRKNGKRRRRRAS